MVIKVLFFFILIGYVKLFRVLRLVREIVVSFLGSFRDILFVYIIFDLDLYVGVN